MNFDAALPLLVVASSLLPGLVIFFLRESSHGLRTALNLGGAALKLLLVGIMIWGVFHQHVYETRWSLAPGLDLVLHADTLSVLFVALSTVLWLVTTVYAIGYLEHSPHRSRFFGFFSLCVSATVGLALAGNLFTTLMNIDAVGSDFVWSRSGGSCGKGQGGLPVTFGAPHIRIQDVVIGGK